MSTQELQQRTAVNIQEKANLIWAIADKLVGTYKPHEYGQVILSACKAWNGKGTPFRPP